MSTLLEVQNLSKYFSTPKGELHAVENVSFKLNAGETLGVVGESGCGKSTLGRTIIHLTESTAGTILFDGEDITHPKNKGELKSLRRQMQMIFQDPFASLNPRMTVEEIIAEPLFIYKVGSKQEIYAKIKKLMDTVGISERIANAYPHELDGGRRQRVGIARALALEPKLIVCDEPVSALDVSIQAQILNLMQDLQEEYQLTYIFITHDMSVVSIFPIIFSLCIWDAWWNMHPATSCLQSATIHIQMLCFLQFRCRTFMRFGKIIFLLGR